MAFIGVSIAGIPELGRRLDAVSDLGPFMRDLALTAVGEQKKLAPVKTGNLRRSIHLGTVSARSATTIAGAKYAAPVEFGSRPHEIRPRSRKMLRFKGRSGVVFARVVRHPGSRARPFMIPGAEAAIRSVAIRDRLVERWNRAA
jgi:hypothetical protein